MKKIIIILLFIININTVKAYENEYFNIEIPQGYDIKINEKGSYKWTKDNKYIAITISNNQQLNYDISTYTKDDIENQKTYIEENINKELKDYDIKVNVSNIKKVLINDKYSLNYNIYWPTMNSTGYDTYQIGNIFTTNNYITTIVYSSDSIISDESEYHKIINSLKINDKKMINKFSYITTIIIIGLSLAIIKVILKYTKKVSHK